MTRILLDLAGLERLIGGDNEAEIKIRECIVQTFAKKHLKKLVNAQAFQSKLDEIKEAVQAEFQAQIPIKVKKSTHWNSRDQYILDERHPTCQKLKQLIKEEAESLMKDILRTVKAEIREEWTSLIEKTRLRLLEEIQKAVKKNIDDAFEATVKAEVNRRFQAIAAQVAQEG
jgi:hypothetical protein